MRRRISRTEAQRTPFIIWNAFIDLLAHSEYEELSEVQRAPHLVFWYESEIQNGGHLQFFENRPAHLIEPTATALRALGSQVHAPIFEEAAHRWRSRPREKSGLAEAYVAVAREGEFDDLDRVFGNARPDLIELLQVYLDANRDEFIFFED